MKSITLFSIVSFSALSLCASVAQEESEAARLRRELEAVKQQLERTIQDQRNVIDALAKRLAALEKSSPVSPSTNIPPLDPSGAVSNAVPPAPPAAQAASTAPSADSSTANQPATAPRWSPSDPIRVRRGNAYMDLGLVGTMAAGGSTASDIAGGLQPGGHDPNQRGFTLQGLEASFSGAVDPYFRANANLLFAIDEGGDSYFELEEAYAETTSLPGNFQVRAGQFLTEFGRHNPTHPHAWSFVDSPLVNARLLGPDGLRNPGARLSWLAPTPFYSEFMLNVQNSHGPGATLFRGGSDGHDHGGEDALPFGLRHAENDRGIEDPGDLMLAPRMAASWDITDTHTLLAGASAAFGPNSSGEAGAGDMSTQIYGLDLTWKWRPATSSGGFPFVAWQSEGLLRRFQAGAFDWDENGNGVLDPGEIGGPGGLPARFGSEWLTDYGFYSQLLYGFKRGWVAGLRGDYLTGERGDYERAGLTLDGSRLQGDPLREHRWRLSPNLTWYMTEFSKIRLQYNYDEREWLGTDHSVWLQFEFILGAHAAHRF